MAISRQETQRTALKNLDERVSTMREGSFFILALLPILALYLATASWSRVKSPDPMTNAVMAWKLGDSGSIVLDDHEDWIGLRGTAIFVVDGNGRPVGQYPPGAALLAAPFYAVWQGEPTVWPAGDPRRPDNDDLDLVVPPLAPAALTASLATALAIALLALTVRHTIGGAAALGGAWLIGTATGAWAVAADTLWQHGPNMMWLALGIWLATTRREWLAGMAFGMAVITRPPTALIAAAVGLALGWDRRSWLPILRVAAGSTAGLVAVIIYNQMVFGSSSVSGGYGDGAVAGATDTDLIAYAKNVWNGLFDGTRGLVTLSPFLVVLTVGAVRVRKHLSAAVVGAAIGGIVYLLVQWKANRFSGGSNFIGYRYPLEMIAAAAPALLLGIQWAIRHRIARILFIVTAAYSLALYASFTVG